jgi:hypothetical protein
VPFEQEMAFLQQELLFWPAAEVMQPLVHFAFQSPVWSKSVL